MIFNAVGVCQLYLTIFQSVLKTIVITIANADPEKGVGWFFNEGKFVIPIAGVILLPFAFQRSTDGLKWASWVAVGSCLLFIISIIVGFGIKCNNGSIDWSQIGWVWTTNSSNKAVLNYNK